MSHPYHGLNELREMFLKFFETKGHLRLPSFSLVPQNDKSILLINAGMTPMKPDGVYVYCTVEGDLPYDDFITLGQRRQREVLERGTLTEDGDARAFFFVSSLPWLHYSQLQHPAVNPNDSNPRISWGKYITVNGRTTLPVSLFVNHALADGLHISRFFQNLETELAALAESWRKS